MWRSLRTLDELNAMSGTLSSHLGIKFTEIGPDFVRGTMPVDARTQQPYGLLHGGASVALAETLGSTGAAMSVSPEYQVVGQEINANHVCAARSGLVTATAKAAHIGGRTHVWMIDIVNGEGQLICISRLTVAVIKRGVLNP
jgi:1,4-dihydroxy-2-naphthoyl-CoA hydrolase